MLYYMYLYSVKIKFITYNYEHSNPQQSYKKSMEKPPKFGRLTQCNL